jgi:TRAP-type C4-dicarboxylate transport system permease large subunit
MRGEARAALLEASWEILLPFVLVAGLFTGALRIHEAAAFTALYVIVIRSSSTRTSTSEGSAARREEQHDDARRDPRDLATALASPAT